MGIWKQTENLSTALLQPINPAVVVFLGAYTILWGLWVICPFWDVFGTANLYSALIDFIPYETFWGAFAIATGALTTYGAYNRSYGALTRGALFAGLHWFIIALFYFMGDFQNTGGITALTFALYAAYVYLNIKVNHTNDERHGQGEGDIFHEAYHHCDECGIVVKIQHNHP